MLIVSYKRVYVFLRRVEWSSDEELVDNKNRLIASTSPGMFLPPINYSVETSPSLQQGRSPISQALSPNAYRTSKFAGNRLLQPTDNPRQSMMIGIGGRRNGFGGLAKSEPALYTSPSSPLEVDQRSNDDSWPVDRKLLLTTTFDHRTDVTSGGSSITPTDSGEPSYGGRVNITEYCKDKGSVVRLPNIYEQKVSRGNRRNSINSNSNGRTQVIKVASTKFDSS